jgi:hypothetical protein
MTGARWALGMLVGAVVAATTGAADVGGDRAVFPFVKGTTWAYAGTVRWTAPPRTVRRNDVRWTSEVVDAFDHGDVAGALLAGGVWDVAWWSPSIQPGDYLLLRVGTRYHVVRKDAKRIFAAVKQSGRKALPVNFGDDVWFAAPLQQGALYRSPQTAPRDDTMYGWLVESAVPVNLDEPASARAPRRGYVLTYATLPDEEHVTVVPGIGITSFAYLHHGTVAEAHLHLVGFHRGSAH